MGEATTVLTHTDPEPRMRMLDGFNEGWISFEGATRKGATTLETVLRNLAGRPA